MEGCWEGGREVGMEGDRSRGIEGQGGTEGCW